MRFVLLVKTKIIIMKKVLLTALVAGCFGLFTSTLFAQDTTTAGQDIKKAAKKTGKAVGKEAKKVGNKTAEIAAKGKAGVVDKVYDGKRGPRGQKIYINNKSRYYWIDKKGHRRFIAEGELKNTE